ALEITIVVVTHELESALRIADRITVLGQGRVLASGTVEEIRASDDPHVQDLLNRRHREQPVDGNAYLDRLTGGGGR
ncbi:MAG: ABC transporter ATP-binding protein, partial [Gammaproteobacteria bacterium]